MRNAIFARYKRKIIFEDKIWRCHTQPGVYLGPILKNNREIVRYKGNESNKIGRVYYSRKLNKKEGQF